MKEQRGSILIFVLFTMTLFIIAALGMMRSTSINQQSASVTDASTNAFQMADSGIELAFRKITKEFVSTINDIGTCSDGVVTESIAHAGLYRLSFYDEDANRITDCAVSTTEIRSAKSVGISHRAMRAIHVHVMVPLDVTDGLLTQWTFDDGGGHLIADAVGSGDHGGYIHDSAYSWTSASLRGTYALQLDGGNSYISLQNDTDFDFSLTDDYTISLWLNTSTISGDDAVFTKSYDQSHRYGLFRRDNQWEFCTKNGGSEECVSADVSQGDWQHIVIVKEGNSEVRLYVDGDQKDDASVVDSEESGSFLIGRAEGSPAGNYEGLIDDMRIYERVLTDDEIIVLCRQRTDGGSCG